MYLQEKGLADAEQIQVTVVEMSATGQMTAPRKPAGSVPMLRLPSGSFIRQSVAIIDYLEDICDDPSEPWQTALSATAVRRTMRGTNPEERARTRDILCLVEEASSHFGLACHKGSVLFQSVEETNADAARLIMNKCVATLELINHYYVEDQRFQSNLDDKQITIADCTLFALLQFADGIYGVNFFEDGALSHLARFYQRFSTRKSAIIPEEHWKQVQDWAPLARQWLSSEGKSSCQLSGP